MTVEKLGTPPLIKEQISSKIKGKIDETKKHFTEKYQENLVLGTESCRPEGYEEDVRNFMETGRYWPLVMGTHKSHPAGFTLMEEAEYIRLLANGVLPEDQQIVGSTFLFASTLSDGQGDVLTHFFKSTEPIREELNAESLFVVRDKEVKENQKSEEEKLRSQREQRSVLGSLVSNGRIPLVLPEGTVESGRQKEGGNPGEINGIVEIKPNNIAYLTHYIKMQGKEPLLFFVGNTGENKIYDPITKKVPTKAQITAVARSNPLLMPFFNDIMSSVVDYPTPYSAIVRDLGNNGRLTKGDLEQYCGERLAQLVPQAERGVYADPELLEKVDVPRITPSTKLVSS